MSGATTRPVPSISWIHTCDYADVGKGGKAILVGLFNRYWVEKVPFSMRKPFYIVLALTDGEGEYSVGLRIESPNGKHVELPSQKAILLHRLKELTCLVGITGFVLDEFGDYRVVPRIDDTLIEDQGRVLFSVHEKK